MLQKSVSVGYCPDFLDDDIDAIIDKLTVQPPPTSGENAQSQVPSDTDDVFGTSWNGPIREQDSDGLNFENPEMSKTIDLGCLALDDQYSSLVIPPPPEESFAVQEIPIVPPVESVKEKRKMFQKSDSEGYLKSFGKKDTVVTSVLQDSKGVHDSKSEESQNDNDCKEKTNSNAPTNDTSPASVSEKLNALLKSLSTHNQEEEDSLGNFRRTSSLRLGRSSSVDILDKIQKSEPTKNQDLVTGSVRVKPKLRPRLSIERPRQNDHVTIPLKSASLERNVEPPVTLDTEPENDSKFHRAHSVDVLHPGGKSDNSPVDDNSVSESFASLKAKLQSYRDSMLNRSLRRKKKVEAEKLEADRLSLDGDKVERRSSLTRSNSFSSLIRRSLGRSAGKQFKKSAEEGRSSSATRAGDLDNVKSDGKDSGTPLAKDRKYWNTLTTSRSNFRPNTGSSQTQVIIHVQSNITQITSLDYSLLNSQ